MFGVGVGIRVGGFTPSSGGGGLNPDAQAFITATGITDATEISAINTLVNDLQGYGLWSKMKAIYPFVGGTSTTCKYNLKDPRDLDAAFRLVFNGGWTFASTGATPNGVNGYADTKLVPSNVLAQNSASMGIYSRTNVAAQYSDYGVYDGVGFLQRTRRASDTGGGYANSLDQYTTNTSSLGFYCLSRISSANFSFYKNGAATLFTSASTGIPALNSWLGACNLFNSILEPTIRQIAFHYISDGLNDTEASNLYSSVQQFNTTLSRQV
jgi:hypothetical protein